MANSYRLMTLKQMVMPDGRLSRTQYLLHLAIYSALVLVLVVLLWSFFDIYDLDQRQRQLRALGIGLIFALPWLLLLYLSMKRAHDLGMPAIVVTPMFISVPFRIAGMFFSELPGTLERLIDITDEITKTANIGMGFYFLLAPGEKGDNRYGPDPLSDNAHNP
jgi:uncharacterized membrane protein YhaH (DUF805 family)